MNLVGRISLAFIAGFVLASSARAADFSLTGNSAVIDLPKDAQFPNGGRITADTLSVSPEGTTVMTQVSAVLGLDKGRVELQSASAALEEMAHLSLQGAVHAVFFADEQPGKKLPAFSFAEVQADRAEYHDGTIVLSGSTLLKLGKANASPLTIQAPSITYTPTGVDDFVFTGPVKATLVPAPGESPTTAPEPTVTCSSASSITADYAFVNRRNNEVIVYMHEVSDFCREGPNPLSGTADALSITLALTGQELLFEKAEGRGVRLSSGDTRVFTNGLCADKDGSFELQDLPPDFVNEIPMAILTGPFPDASVLVQRGDLSITAIGIIGKGFSASSPPESALVYGQPAVIRQSAADKSEKLFIESLLPIHLDKVGLFISPEARFAGRFPITITSPDATVTCSSASSIFDEHSNPINVTCTEGTLVSKVSNRDISMDFTVLFFDFKTNTGRSNGSDYNQRPLTLRIAGTETSGAIELVSQNLDFRVSQKNADNTPAPSSAIFSGDTVIKLSPAKDHPSGGFTSDVTVTSQRVEITQSKEGWTFITPALSASGSAQSGPFTLKAGKCDANLDSSFSVTSAVLSDALEVVTPAGKLIGETAAYENGRWLVSGRTAPVRFSREALMLETEKVLFDPKTGEIIPEGGAFRVVESADK